MSIIAQAPAANPRAAETSPLDFTPFDKLSTEQRLALSIRNLQRDRFDVPRRANDKPYADALASFERMKTKLGKAKLGEADTDLISKALFAVYNGTIRGGDGQYDELKKTFDVVSGFLDSRDKPKTRQ
jgi:hypothetical protein